MAEGLPSALARLLDAGASNEVAWQNFIGQYSRLILSVARSSDRDYDAAMERYTFVLESLRRDDFRKLRGYIADPRCKFTTWLVVVCRRLCIDYARSKYGRVRAGSDVIELRTRRSLAQSLFSTVELDQIVSPEHERPDLIAEQGELHARLAQCLGCLSAQDRLLIKLRFEDDLPAIQIMRLLRMPTPFHVYRRLNRLVADLRAALTLGPPVPAQKRGRPSVKSQGND